MEGVLNHEVDDDDELDLLTLNHICGGTVEVLSNGDGMGLRNLQVVSE
jgi:hypothetical protein